MSAPKPRRIGAAVADRLSPMGRRLTDEERAFRAISEKEHQAEVCRHAETYGWSWRHFHDSRREVVRKGGKRLVIGDKDAAGWPDLVIVRPPEILFVECKKETGVVSPDQEEWLGYLRDCGLEVFVSRPSGLEEIVRRLARPRQRVARSS